MATPSEKPAESLEVLHALQERGVVAIRSGDLKRTHRERLCKNGFLQEVIKGWYIPARPDETTGVSTAWYASFWLFCASYLQHLKGKDWCLSPEQSLSLHADNWTVPRQLLVRAAKARNNITALPHDTSLLVIRASMPEEKDIVEKDGLRLFSLPTALIACAPGYFRQNPTDMRAALSMVRDASEVLDRLLEGGHSTIAGRLAVDAGLKGKAPREVSGMHQSLATKLSNYSWISHCNGMFQLEAALRIAPGVVPSSFLKAFANANSDWYPTAWEMCPITISVSMSSSRAFNMRQRAK